jgi:hypothetical protein
MLLTPSNWFKKDSPLPLSPKGEEAFQHFSLGAHRD